jgi:hypothetical protein
MSLPTRTHVHRILLESVMVIEVFRLICVDLTWSDSVMTGIARGL